MTTDGRRESRIVKREIRVARQIYLSFPPFDVWSKKLGNISRCTRSTLIPILGGFTQEVIIIFKTKRNKMSAKPV